MPGAYRVEHIDGHTFSRRRGVAVLRSDQDRFVNAAGFIAGLKAHREQRLLSILDAWRDHVLNNRNYHRWDKDTHGGIALKCFVFKPGRNDRLLGFLVNPDPQNPRFTLCVLVHYFSKHDWEVPPRKLKRTNELREDDDVVAAVEAFI